MRTLYRNGSPSGHVGPEGDPGACLPSVVRAWVVGAVGGWREARINVDSPFESMAVPPEDTSGRRMPTRSHCSRSRRMAPYSNWIWVM